MNMSERKKKSVQSQETESGALRGLSVDAKVSESTIHTRRSSASFFSGTLTLHSRY